MANINDDKFSIFIPFEIEKGGVGEDKYSNMRVKGIASSTKQGEDSDGETLEPDGMDLTDLLTQGNINFHHLWTKDPSAIIGEPTKAEIRDNELYIEGRLYPSSQKARDVYDLGMILEKDSDTRRLGFSIEGKALKRDPKNKNRILKSKLSAVAITPSPKCKGTRMNIMKGGLEDVEFELIKGDTSAMDSPNGDSYLVDVTDINGVRRTVDKNFNIKVWTIEKAMQAGYATGRDTTNQLSGQEALKVESLDRKKKNKKTTGFTKGEIYVDLFSIFNLSDTDLVKSMYSFIEEIQKGLTPNMANGITQEAIDKAKLLLKGSAQGPFGDDVPKGQGGISDQERATLKVDTNANTANKDNSVKITAREQWDKLKLEFDTIVQKVNTYADQISNIDLMIQSAAMGDPDGDNLSREDGNFSVTKDAIKLAPKQEVSQLKLDTSVDGPHKTGGTVDGSTIKSQDNDIIKGFDVKIEELNKKLIEKDNINKALQSSFDQLSSKVDQLLKANPGPRSITTSSAIERFAPTRDGERTLSLARNKKEIVAELVKAAGNEFSETNIFAQAASAVEIAGALGNNNKEAAMVADLLRKKSGIIITG